MQSAALTEYAGRRGWTFQTYFDVASGSKQKREGLDELMRDARLKLFDVVVVTRFDRFARSTRHLVEALEEFQALGIDFISLGESIDTSSPIGKMCFVVIGAVAELERNIIRERVSMGIQRARAAGKRIGRPKRIVDAEKVRRLRSEGASFRKIAKICDVSTRTIERLLKPRRKNPATGFATGRSYNRASGKPAARSST